MARTARRTAPGGIYHVISRFVDHTWFLSDDEERTMYLRMLGAALSQSDWRCLSYALMSSHLHFAMVAGQLPMASWTKRVNSPFAHWMNRRRGRIGPVFAGRAKDLGYSSARLGHLLAYIHNNPVRAHVVERAADSSWTSHRGYMGIVKPPEWLHVREGLHRAGFDDPAGFDAWVIATPGERDDPSHDKIKREARKRGALVLATPSVASGESFVPLVGAPHAHVRPDPRSLIEMVADLTSIQPSEICSRRRIKPLRSARLIVVACGLELGLTKSELATALGISAQAVHLVSQREPSEVERRIAELVVSQVLVAFRAARRAS